MADGRRKRGEGALYQRANGTWVGVVDLGMVDGKRLRKTVTASSLKELRPKFKRLKQGIESGVLPDEMTVTQWFNHWLEHEVDRKLRPVTAAGYRRYVEKWVIPTIGHQRLDRLKPDHLETLYAKMQDAGKADATRRQVHAIIRRALVIAERQQRIGSNPATKVDPPPVGKGSHGKFTLDQALTILKVLDHDDVRASRWACALLAGIRQGEALGLRWEDVDFERGVLVIQRAVQQVPKQGLQVVPLKSETSYRAVPMVMPVREALWAERQATGYVWGNGDRPLAPRKDWAQWKDVLKLAGVPDRPLHAARATTASLLMEAGVSEKVIAEILGHSQVIITQKHYLHGDERMHLDAMGKLDTLMGGTLHTTAPPGRVNDRGASRLVRSRP